MDVCHGATSSVQGRHHNLATTFLVLTAKAVARVSRQMVDKSFKIGSNGRNVRNHAVEGCKIEAGDAYLLGNAKRQSSRDAITIRAHKV